MGATVALAMEDHLRLVGARIRTLREARGLTQDQLGDMIGVREKTISRWENGRHQAVLANIRKVADALEVDVAEITGQMPAPLGLGASEDQVEQMAREFRGYVLELLTMLNRGDEARTEVAGEIRGLLERQDTILASIQGLLQRQSEVLERIETLVRTLPTDQATRELTAALSGVDLPDQPAPSSRGAIDREGRAR